MLSMEELIRERNEKSRYAKLLGIVTTEIGEGYAKGELKIRQDHINGIGSVHGGGIYSLADTICGSLAASYGEWATTVSSSFNFLRAALDSTVLYAEASEIRRGKRISVFDVKITDEKERLIATGTFTYFNMERTTGS